MIQDKTLRMENRIKMSLRQIWVALAKSKEDVTDEMIGQYHMRYYNIKAMQLLLANGIYLWTNCSNVAALLTQFQEHGIIPPLEEWEREWQAYVQSCIDARNNRMREREETRLWQKKWQHLARLKEIKLASLLDGLVLHDGVFVSVYAGGLDARVRNRRVSVKYYIQICIDNAKLDVVLDYHQADSCVGKVIDAIARMNEWMPQLRREMADDGRRHGVELYLSGDSMLSDMVHALSSLYLSDTPMFGGCELVGDSYASCQTIGRIREIYEQLRVDLNKCGGRSRARGTAP